MTKKEALRRVKSYLTDYLPLDNYEEVEEIVKALEQEPCEDAISRENALQALCQAVHKNDSTIPCLNQRVSCLWNKTKVQDYAEEILKLPSVTPQPKTGRWNRVTDKTEHLVWECDCGWQQRFATNFCPDCGAKMEVNK